MTTNNKQQVKLAIARNQKGSVKGIVLNKSIEHDDSVRRVSNVNAAKNY